jgi:hypothetical protein
VQADSPTFLGKGVLSMTLLSNIFEPQNMAFSFGVWTLILLLVSFTTYGMTLVTGSSVYVIGPVLIIGGYLGNVVGRAFEWVPITQNMNVDAVMLTTQAAFAGMFAAMMLWFLANLVPLLMPERTVVRVNEPKGVVGGTG